MIHAIVSSASTYHRECAGNMIEDTASSQLGPEAGAPAGAVEPTSPAARNETRDTAHMVA